MRGKTNLCYSSLYFIFTMGRQTKKKDKKKFKRSQGKVPKATLQSKAEDVSVFSGKGNGERKGGAQYTIDELLNKAEECIDTFNYDVAQKFCQRALEMDADHLRALETSGTLCLELGNPEAAKQCFGRAVELSPTQGHAKYMTLGQLFEGAQAIQCYQKGIEIMVTEMQQQQADQVAAACASPSEGSTGVTSKDLSTAYCAVAEIYMTDCCFDDNAEQLCKENIEKAIAADENNPEAFQMMASFKLTKDEKDKAREMIEKSVNIWLTKYKEAEKGNSDSKDFDPVQVIPLNYQTRIASSKILVEVESYELASEVLEGLLDEDDEVVQVWYLLGWLNYLQGEEYKGNARYYLRQADKLSKKVECDDDPMLEHIQELLQELGPGDEGDEDDDENLETADNDAELEVDSDSDVEEPMDQ